MPERLDRDGTLSLWRSDYASDAFVRQIEATTFGSSGLRYRRLDVGERLARCSKASFFELRDGDRLLATYALIDAPLRLDGRAIAGSYRSLLTVAPGARGRGLGGRIVRAALDWLEAQADGRPHLAWGCIERRNEASARVLDALGAHRIGSLEASLVYRQFTRRDEAVVEIEAPPVAADYSLAPGSNSDESHCFGLIDEAGIAISVCAEPVRIAFADRAWTRVYGALIDLLPPARRRFDPRDFRYLRLSRLAVRPGADSDLPRLLSDLMRRFGVHMASFCLDPDDPLCTRLDEVGLFGRFAQATRETIDVSVIPLNIERETIAASRPIAVTPLDL